MSDDELIALWTGNAPVRQLDWDLELVFRLLKLPEDADHETVVSRARGLIDDDELPVQAAEVLAANGYPELDPDLDDSGDDDLAEDDDDYSVGPDGVRLV